MSNTNEISNVNEITNTHKAACTYEVVYINEVADTNEVANTNGDGNIHELLRIVIFSSLTESKKELKAEELKKRTDEAALVIKTTYRCVWH